jgi:hypothetical protein
MCLLQIVRDNLSLEPTNCISSEKKDLIDRLLLEKIPATSVLQELSVYLNVTSKNMSMKNMI